MPTDPYASGKFSFNPYAKKSDVTGCLVVVLDGRFPDRGLELIDPISRAVKKHEIHEMILSLEQAKPGGRVEAIAYLAFFEVEQGGVLVAGDEVEIPGKWAGRLLGYDETHLPNHLNVVVGGNQERTGAELGLEPGDRIIFRQPGG